MKIEVKENLLPPPATVVITMNEQEANQLVKWLNDADVRDYVHPRHIVYKLVDALLIAEIGE